MTYAGRLPGGDEFPEENVEHVREQVQRMISNLRPRAVLGSAAAGADLLVLEAALRSGAHARVVLAGTFAEFRESSVAGRGSRWEQLYDALPAHEQVELVALARGADDADSYREVTQRLNALADEAADGETVVSLTISRPREGEDHSAELATAQRLRDRLLLRIDPARAREQTATAFVAMPYGRRADPSRGTGGYEADATYRRILLPALIDAGYRPVRADAEALLEVIDITMLRAINDADVLVADLATLNANVMWELGVRHAWRRAGTILLRPAGTKVPFDVSHARVHEYARDADEVSDRDAVAGIQLLQGLLGAVSERRTDSPVFATVPDLEEVTLPAPADAAGAGRAQEHVEAVALAADLRDAPRLKELAERIAGDAELGVVARRSLLEQTGLALIAAGEHDAAARILAPLADADRAMSRVRLQQQYAHALIRSSDPHGRAERLALAERRLSALIERSAPSGETYGLLGSAGKARVEDELANGRAVGEAEISLAIDAYMRGFRLDPGDYYPGIVALALLRLRGAHLRPNARDLHEARELLPVVRFAATRLGGPDERDVWGLATVAELDLHEHFLYEQERARDALDRAKTGYARVGAVGGRGQRASATRQLRLFRDAGDSAEVIDGILELFAA